MRIVRQQPSKIKKNNPNESKNGVIPTTRKVYEWLDKRPPNNSDIDVCADMASRSEEDQCLDQRTPEAHPWKLIFPGNQ